MPITEAHGGHALTHLSWNEAGSDLAVVDVTGRVSVYHIPFALNSVNGLRQPAFSPDDGSQIVGMMWLNTQRSVGRSANHICLSMLNFLGACILSSSQSAGSLGLLAVPSPPNRSVPSCK